jgi:MOSC domain-containing protein
MSVIGTVESLWRYPVKSMRGEELDEMFAGYAGIYGDRVFAFTSSACRPGFPYFTAREKNGMLQYQPRFRRPEKAARPMNQAEAEKLPPGATPLYASADELMVDVELPGGKTLAIDDPELIGALRKGVDDKHQLTLLRSDRALTDCRPMSIFSLQSAKALGEEAGINIDKRRFRANVYLDVNSEAAFAEEKWVGRSLRIGPKVVVSIVDRDPRCVMITLDPDTGDKAPVLLKAVAQAHNGMAGVYGAVLVQGMVRKGDAVELLEA